MRVSLVANSACSLCDRTGKFSCLVPCDGNVRGRDSVNFNSAPVNCLSLDDLGDGDVVGDMKLELGMFMRRH